MKTIFKILTLFVFVATISYANEKNHLESIYNNIIIKNTKEAIKDSDDLLNALDSKKDIKESFKDLVKSWKSVETLYLAGDLNEDYLDTPRYIDVFHNLKENLSTQVKRALDSKDDIEIELFKNSFKTINALEYVLFNDKNITDREIKASKIIVNNIKNHLNDILEVYTNSKNKLLKDEKWSNATIMNQLIDSSYKLKEWRVGDAAGLSRKYKKDGSDNRRSEYFLSGLSIDAIKAILETHKNIIGKQSFSNFGDMAINSGAKDEVAKIRKDLDKTIALAEKIKNNDFTTKEGKALYKSLRKLHNGYYLSLISALKVTSKILDADGD